MEKMQQRDMKKVILYWMDGEITNFFKVWLCVYISLTFCYLATRRVIKIPKGLPRFISFLPILCLFILLPLNLHSLLLGITTAFFVAWLSTFKLIMLAFGLGPLSDPALSLPRFLALASLPIRIKKSDDHSNGERRGRVRAHADRETVFVKTSDRAHADISSDRETVSAKTSGKAHADVSTIRSLSNRETVFVKTSGSVLNYVVKGFLLASMIKLYDYHHHLHPIAVWIMYCFYMYFALEIILAMVATVARVVLGAELEPTFNEPLLSTSLQDFWGRRWNIMVTRVLRPTVYDPVHYLSEKILGRSLAPLPAVFSTFVVSGLMHELIIYYMGRRRPTWKVTGFFLLHGAALAVEIVVKKVVGERWHVPRFVGTGLVFVFVMGTGLWLFLPEMLRTNADVRAFEEHAAVGAFVKDVTRALAFYVVF